MDFQIVQLDEMILAGVNGSSRASSLNILKAYLIDNNEAAQSYYFIEMVQGGKVIGAMSLAKLAKQLPKAPNIHSNVLKAGMYLVFDMTYEAYLEDGKGKTKIGPQIEEFLKDKSYKTAGFPMFEFIPNLDSDTIRVMIPLK